ncbi:MAG TPA: LysM domain-containing protein [Dehalococcoidia bacterium]|nr:LysM domain-containing protein [Dehalococcoidia bacterium]
MDCYLCDNEASQRCPRCGNPFCGDHGEDLCADCLNPVNAAPSGAVFRASLLAMLLGSVLALWLLIRPPGLPGDSAEIAIPQASPQPITPAAVSPTPTPPVASATTEPTPVPTAVPTPTPTEAPPAPIEYTVVDGDTWSGIAEAYGIDAESLAAYNGLTLDDFLQPGQVLTIPQ